MLKKSLQASLLGAAAMVMASPAFAEEAKSEGVKLGGSIKTYFVQTGTGETGNSARLQSFSEANLGAKVKRGNVTGFFELEQRARVDSTTTRRWVSYDMDNIKMTVGTVVNKETTSFAVKGGASTTAMSNQGFFKGLLVFTEMDGLGVNFKISDAAVISATMYDGDFFKAANYGSTNTGKTTGSTTQVGAKGKIGALQYRVASVTGTSIDYDDSTAEKPSSAGSQLGVKYALDSMSVSLDMGSKKVATAKTTSAAEYATTTSDMALQAKVKVGEAKVIVTLATQTKNTDKTGAKSTDDAYTNLAYTIPLAKGARMEFLYASQAVTNNADTTKSHTISTMGVGLFTKF